MGQQTRIGRSSVAVMMPPTIANPINVGTIVFRVLKLRLCVALELGISSKIIKQLNPRYFAFDVF
jgi:hypothetical protein